MEFQWGHNVEVRGPKNQGHVIHDGSSNLEQAWDILLHHFQILETSHAILLLGSVHR